MRRSTVVVTALAVVVLGTGIWIALRMRPRTPTAVVSVAVPVEQPTPVAPPQLFELPPEPEPPAPGTPERQIYFSALVAGDERSLTALRKALADAKAAGGRTEAMYLRKLEAMERAYAARLSRHRDEIKVGPALTP